MIGLFASPIVQPAVDRSRRVDPVRVGIKRSRHDLVRQTLASPGHPLDAAARADFEQRFAHDFSRVRIHTDPAAASSARAVAAQAYTVGDRIAFAHGTYQPQERGGGSLLAHELAHVRDGSPGLHRRVDPAIMRDFERRAVALRSLPLYQQLKPAQVAIARDIIAMARRSTDPIHFIEKLELLFTTPMRPQGNRAAQGSAQGAQMAAAETTRLASGAGGAHVLDEEILTVLAPSRDWTPRRGENGTLFFVDTRSLDLLRVRVKVRLLPGPGATTADVENIRKLEDGIEKAASARGYSVDLQFVDQPGPDVFDVKVNPAGWTDSRNWSALAAQGPQTLAHELHHLLGLPDRYNYIDAHAGNADMEIGDRLIWFRVQMQRTYDLDLDQRSIMGHGQSVTETDIDEVAGLTNAQEARRMKLFQQQDAARPRAKTP